MPSDKSNEEKKVEDPTANLKEFDLAEIEKHNSENDCWLIINGGVYNTTEYVDKHPGGPEIMLDFAGKDATEDFEDTGHSQDARKDLEKFLIGKVKGMEMKSASAAGGTGGGSGDGMNPIYLILPIILALIGYFVMNQ